MSRKAGEIIKEIKYPCFLKNTEQRFVGIKFTCEYIECQVLDDPGIIMITDSLPAEQTLDC